MRFGRDSGRSFDLKLRVMAEMIRNQRLMKQRQDMRINDPQAYRTIGEADLLDEMLDLKARRLLELGCGAAHMTRLLAERFGPREIVATEVDRIQHERNLAAPHVQHVSFRLGGAQEIADPADSYDLVLMFKSLHHVPRDQMYRALREIHRVLKPGGMAWFSEPVYWGPFNDLLRLVHDEREVREAAFAVLTDVVDSGMFALEAEVFFQVPGIYESWQVFEDRFLNITHTELDLGPKRREEIQRAFEDHMTSSGASFLKPHRVDLLRKAG